MIDPNSIEYSRNKGFWSTQEQEAICGTSVAIAGVGGDGFQLGQKLARMGIQTFDIADPEVFEPENVNRVPGATTNTYGQNKAEVFRDKVLEINPNADVRVFTEGVNPDNIEDFMQRADLVFDETELTNLALGTLVSDAARARGIPDVFIMNVGFAAQITSFRPEGKHSFRSMMGIPKDMPIDEVADVPLDISRCLPYLPTYVDKRTLEAVMSDDEDAPLPSISQGVDVASALGTSQALLHITHKLGNRRQEPIWAPRFGYMDALTLKSGTTRFPRTSFYLRLAGMLTREALGRNPKASYAKEDRELWLPGQEIE